MKKKMLLIGYTRINLGDDLFLSMVINRYPDIDIDLHVPRGYQYPFLKAKNVNIIFENIENVNIDNYCVISYVAGSIFSEISKNYDYKIWLDKLVKESKQKNIPFLFISSNYGPEYTKKWFKLCDSIIKNSFHVNFRDKISFEKFNYKNVSYIPDLILSLNYKQNKKEENSVGISIIDLYSLYRGEINQYYFNYMNFLKKNIINYIENNKKVYLFSFCKYEGDELAIDNLLTIIDKKYHNSIVIVKYDGNINKFLNIYSRMEYFLCTRFHSMILSHLFEQKIFICSYSNKLLNVIDSYKFKYNFLSINGDLSNHIIDLKKYKKIDKKLVNDSKKNFDVLDGLLSDVTSINDDFGIGNFFEIYKIKYKKIIKKIIIKSLDIVGIKKYLLKIKNKKVKVKVDNVDKKDIDKSNINLLNWCKSQNFISENCFQNSMNSLGYECSLKKSKDILDGPLVSIVIPTYKRDKYLFECIDSILNQNYKNIEIIVVDDYVESKLQKEFNKRYGFYKNIKYAKNKINSKAGKTRQNGYRMAKGKYIIFCDDDDFYVDDEFVFKAVKIMEYDSSINLVGFNNFVFRQYNNSIEYKSISYFGKCNSLDYITSFQVNYFKPFPSCAVFRKSVLDDRDFYNMEMMNDSSIFLNAMLNGNMYIMRESVMFYRIHSANITNSLDSKFIIDNLLEKEKVYLDLKNNNKISNVDEWWFNQILLTVRYYINGSKPSADEFHNVNSWVLKHLKYNQKKYLKITKKLYKRCCK